MKFKSIGHDSEFFIFGSKGIIVPTDITDGTKKEPETKWDNTTWQADGMALEIGSVSPYTSKRAFANGIHESFVKTCRDLAKRDMILSEDIVTNIPDEYLQGGNAELGCSPDYNAYTASQNPRPNPKLLGSLRCVGRHVHIGVVEDDGKRLKSENLLALVKALDITMGSGCVGRDFPQHAARTQYYGMAGSFRPKPYGVEYRVPSFNFLNGSGEWIFDAVIDAIDLVNSGELEEMIAFKGGEDNLIHLVNSGRAVLSSKQRSGRGIRVGQTVVPTRTGGIRIAPDFSPSWAPHSFDELVVQERGSAEMGERITAVQGEPRGFPHPSNADILRWQNEFLENLARR